jgi:hypothetical protein
LEKIVGTEDKMNKKSHTAIWAIVIVVGILWSGFFLAPILEFKYAVHQINQGIPPPNAHTMSELREIAPFSWFAARVMNLDVFEEGLQRSNGSILLALCAGRVAIGLLIIAVGLFFLPLPSNKNVALCVRTFSVSLFLVSVAAIVFMALSAFLWVIE